MADRQRELRHQLSDALTKIDTLISGLSTAEQRASQVTRYYQELKVGQDQYGNRTIPENLLGAAAKANAIIKAQLTEAAEEEFREKAKAVAAEIEALRAILPNLAAKACIELGEKARLIAKLSLIQGGSDAN